MSIEADAGGGGVEATVRKRSVRPALVVAALANSALLVVQIIGGIVFDSLALLADAIHQASDVVSLLLAIAVAGVAARPPSNRYTFGLGRADAIGGLIHAALLLAGAIVVTAEAIRRFGNEPEVNGAGVVVLAAAGLIVNGFSAGWLHRGHDHSLNIHGAVLHLAADALGSLVVLIGGALIWAQGWDWVDPIGSLAVAALIVWSAWGLGLSSLRVLMDGVPPGVDIDHLTAVLLEDPAVDDAHHLHVRSLSGSLLSLTAHVRVEADTLHDAQVVTERLTGTLAAEGVAHVTLQVECHPCDGEDHVNDR